jgi:hypothetical protein
MKHLLTILTCLSAITISGQNISGINLSEPYLKKLEKNNLTIIDSTNLYSNDGDSKTLFYYSLVPNDAVIGVLVLLPGTWETVENVFNNNIKLIELACYSNLLTIVPSINYNLCLDETALNFLNTTFTDILRKYKPQNDNFIIAGLSLGGMNAIRYTEMAYENEIVAVIKPKAVFAVDPPLDLSRLYYTLLRTIEINFSELAVNEAKDYIKRLNNLFGGPPENYPEKYYKYSMYSRNQKEGGNAKYLKDVPVRIYSDPDINWQMKNRHVDYYDMNALDQAAMINELNILGNNEAEFINALGKGYRLNGMRHPHSWSLIEPTECVNWIMKYMK